MSVKATERAWDSGASGNDLLVYLALADHAGGEDDPYGYAYPSVKRLEQMTRLSRRTVQRCLRTLEEQGFIRATGHHPWGGSKVTTIYRIERGRQDDAPASDDDRGGVTEGTEGASPVTPKPSKEPSKEPSTTGSAPPKKLPDGFPDELRPHGKTVLRMLREFAAEEGAHEVKSMALARVLMAFPRKPLVREALKCMAHHEGEGKKNVVATYRNWLERCNTTLAGTEKLTDDGMPYDGPSAVSTSGNVTPMRGRPSAQDFAAAGRRLQDGAS